MRIIVFVLLAIGSVSSCLAQLDNATILGTVTDASGAIVPGAIVAVQKRETGATVNLVSDGNGNFVAAVLPVGTYRVTVSAKGFKMYVRDTVTLRVADRTRVDISLVTGEITERVTVTSEAPIVETASTTLGGVISTQQVNELPLNGRSLSSLLGIVPGVVMLGTTQQRSMGGTSMSRLWESGSRLLVDGGDSGQVDSDLPDSAYASAARITRASVDAISEIRIQETSYSAEYGQSMGGVVNFITKSGTNLFHGGLFEYFRNEKLDARNYFNPSSQSKPPFRLNQFGGTFGGPIIKDRLFFFINYEGVRQRLGIFQNTFVPTQAFRDTLPAAVKAAANTLPLPNGTVSPTEPRLARFTAGYSNQLSEDTGSAKIDYLVTSNDRLAVRYNGNGSFTKTYFGPSDGQFRPVPGLLQLGKITYTKTISPTLLNEAGFAFNRLHDDPAAGGNSAILSLPIVVAFAGMAPIGQTLFDLKVANNSYTYQDTVSWVKGRQQIKFGAQIVFNQANKAIGPQGYLQFLSLDDFAKNNPFLYLTVGQPRMGMRNRFNHLFVQDDLQVNSKLTLNLGLRYQYDTAPTESHGRFANFNPVTGDVDPAGTPLFEAPKANFGPRIGIAYTPFASKQTVFRFGYGIFHSGINPAAAQTTPGNLVGISQSATFVSPGQGFPLLPVSFGGVGRNLAAFPKDYQAPYSENYNFNIQQGFGQNSVLQVGYVGNRGLHENPNQELNRINPLTKLRKYPQFGTISNFFNGANSNYNSLQTSFRKRLTQGLTFNVNYTWSHNLDQSGVVNGAASLPQDDAHFNLEYGNADYDVRHNLEFDYTYQIPGLPVVPKIIGGGWQLNGMTVMRSGLPFNITCGCDPTRIGTATGRPDLVLGVPLRPDNFDLPGNQLNLAAFKAPVGHFGNLGRNVLSGPSAYNWDFSLFKNFKLNERNAVQFRAEMFNLFNIPQFSNPQAAISAPATFGKSLSTIPAVGGFGSNRQIQFALRYSF